MVNLRLHFYFVSSCKSSWGKEGLQAVALREVWLQLIWIRRRLYAYKKPVSILIHLFHDWLREAGRFLLPATVSRQGQEGCPVSDCLKMEIFRKKETNELTGSFVLNTRTCKGFPVFGWVVKTQGREPWEYILGEQDNRTHQRPLRRSRGLARGDTGPLVDPPGPNGI